MLMGSSYFNSRPAPRLVDAPTQRGVSSVEQKMKELENLFASFKAVVLVRISGDLLCAAGPILSSMANDEQRKNALADTMKFVLATFTRYTTAIAMDSFFTAVTGSAFPTFNIMGKAHYTARALVSAAASRQRCRDTGVCSCV